MARMSVFTRYLLACMALSPIPALAYEGLTAPAHDDAPARATNSQEEKHGYPGLSVGAPAVPDEEEDRPVATQKVAPRNTAPAEPQYTPMQQYTPSPYNPNVVIKDLPTAAAVYGTKSSVKVPEGDFSQVQHSRIKGKLPVPYMVEQEIAQAMASINNKKLPRSEREKTAKAAYKRFSDVAAALRNKQQVPDTIYKSMKLSDTYIREEKEGTAEALSQLDKALDTLKPLQ